MTYRSWQARNHRMARAKGFQAFCAAALFGVMLAQNAPGMAQTAAGPADATASTTAPRDPTKGAVTNLPLPRFVTLKSGDGNARRGPGLTHRIDWVFIKSGMPLLLTAEYENWRRVEDAEGFGGWVHYSLLSGTRSVLVSQDMAEFHTSADAASEVVFQAERGVIGKLLECSVDWCRVNTNSEKGWVEKAALWGVNPDEILQ